MAFQQLILMSSRRQKREGEEEKEEEEEEEELCHPKSRREFLRMFLRHSHPKMARPRHHRRLRPPTSSSIPKT
ncbi:hypothetical protein EBZ39_03335 [bacterium]|nr:hypothetical protein [bacterium]